MSSVQSGIATPGIYLGVNTNTSRAGLPANVHKVLFITADTKVMNQPVVIYDKADADDKIAADSAVSKMITAAVKTNRLIDAHAITKAAELDDTLDIIAPLGHTILALDAAPVGDDTEALIDHLEFVSGAIEKKPAILVVPFTDIEAATTFAAQAAVETSYRVVAACYHGATGQDAQIAGAMAAALADSNDPALPFNGVTLEGVAAVDDQYKLTFERQERALKAGVCVIATGVDGKPEIVRAVSTYRKNKDTGESDTLMLDINAALTIDYTRKVIRQELSKQPRRKNTAAQRRHVRSVILAQLVKLDDAEILKNVKERADELTVTADPIDDYRANAAIPADCVRGMHVIAGTLNVY